MDITAKQFQTRFKPLAAQFRTPADIDVLLQNCTLSQVPAGTRIIAYRGPVSSLYLLWDGRLAASVEEGDIKLELGDIHPGQWVGEVTLIDPGPANASVTTVEESQLLAISHETFNRLRETHPAVAGALLRALCLNITERLRPTGERVIDQIGSHAYRLHDLPPAEKAKGFRLLVSLLVGLLGTHPGGADGHQ